MPGQRKGTVNAPSANEVAVLLTDADAGKRDIVLQRRSSNPNDLTIIDSLHRKYDSLQYPIILPYGQDGYNVDKKIKAKAKKEASDTTLQFYKFHLMFRENSQNHLHRCRELFQQYVVGPNAPFMTLVLSTAACERQAPASTLASYSTSFQFYFWPN